MRSVTTVLSGKTKDGESFNETLTLNVPTTEDEAKAIAGGDVVKFIADYTTRMRENGVKNGLVATKKGADLSERFASLVKTYGDAWVWSPRGAGIKALVAQLTAAQASGDTEALAAIVAEMATKYGATEEDSE
jgi:hypothetical protein